VWARLALVGLRCSTIFISQCSLMHDDAPVKEMLAQSNP
jgi:hypothetical protein